MWKETGNGRRDVGTAAGASFVPWTVNAQMSKNRINPPASMIFDRTKLAAAGAGRGFAIIARTWSWAISDCACRMRYLLSSWV